MSNVPKDIKQIEEAVWEIPTSFKQGMNVPARVYATKKLLEAMDQGVFDQVTNVACLPGIQRAALCMPDGHWGYGFPIGGVAAMDAENGVISPGGIGFDINCIDGNSNILTEFGYTIKIKDYLDNPHMITKSIAFGNNKEISTKPILFMKKENEQNIFKIKTKSGHEIIASADHPFYTDKGMIKLEELNKDNYRLAINPFEGTEYEKPNDTIILNEEDILKVVPNRLDIIKELKSKGLLPLKLDSDKLPIIARLIGFIQGDGHLSYYYNKYREQNIWFTIVIGSKEDLLKVKSDVEILGYKSSSIFTKEYHSQIREYDNKKRKIDGISTQMRINSQAFSVLMHVLGVPKGNKSYTGIFVPNWVKIAPLWIKRLYLSGLFGAELSKPQQSLGENFNFKEPSLNQNKVYEFLPSLREFLMDIKSLLLEFDINCNKIYLQKGVINKKGDKTFKLSLKISSEIKNLINLWRD